jgi:hypothetical protein
VSEFSMSLGVLELLEMTFITVGTLPAALGIWHVRRGGGRLWFVNEDPTVAPYAIVEDEIVSVVDAIEEPFAPLIMPKVGA